MSSAASTADHLEVEVKFLVANLTAVRNRVIEAGAKLRRERVWEQNVRYDTVEDSLLQRGELLRLRQDKRAIITFKGLSQEAIHSEAKVREELEITVDDFDTAAAIIRRLGFSARQTYEKYRETFSLGEVEIVLDELPFGDFVELEGTEPAIKQAAAALNLDWQKRLTINYLALLEMAKEHYQLPFNDLTFANFTDTTHTITRLLSTHVVE